MRNLLEETFLMGLGVLSVTKKTAEKFVNDAISSSKITQEEGDSFLKTFTDAGEKAHEDLKKTIEEVFQTRGKALLPLYKDVSALQEKVKALESRVAELEAPLKKEGEDAK